MVSFKKLIYDTIYNILNSIEYFIQRLAPNILYVFYWSHWRGSNPSDRPEDLIDKLRRVGVCSASKWYIGEYTELYRLKRKSA
jgi:hypothetical protein